MNKENYEKSLIQSRAALKDATTLKDNAIIALIYNTIGGNFDGLLEYEKAMLYYKKGLSYAQTTNKNEIKFQLNNNLGNIYFFDKKDFKKGVFYYEKAILYSAKIKDTSKILFTKINMAWAHFDVNKFHQGFKYLQFVNTHFKKHGNNTLETVHNMLNGMYFRHKKEPEKADSFFNKAIKTGILYEEKSDLSYTYLEYSKFLNQMGDYKKAYSNLEKYNILTEEINSEDKIKKANVAGINLELDEYKREIDNISSTYKNKENYWLAQQSRNKKIVLLIVTISLLIFIILYFFSKNEKLKQKNKLREIQNKIQQNLINATIDGQESERKKIAAFLHDNISALLSSAGMHLNVFSSKNQDQSVEIIKTKYILEEAHHKVRDLSHELMPSLLVRFGLIYALEDLCEKNSNSNIHFEFHSSVDETTRFKEFLEMKLYFVISELLNNILKHSNANLAKLDIKMIQNQLNILVIDNGNGFEDETNKNMEGFGLNRIKARIHNMKGTIYILSDKKNGTTVELLVPIV
ncbi:ATP-binding protein [Flavobacterium sp. TSSA_36]|uniref:tetratricopeptide repeat-containing sensor histidine kinase n=1 Tax=Flavobacterium sp. TSSA_36 TaxID=3447669 RepID=UPI003F34C0FA